jgi:outer membrane protein assembly factor BamB
MMRCSLLAGLVLIPGLLCAENWPQWRGPFFNGSTTETNLPVQWSQTNGVAWVAPLPGYSGATPIIWDDSVFVSSPDPQKNLLLLCLETSTGKPRWQKVVATGDRDRGRNNMASPSPVTDGKCVFVIFATGDLAAFDFSGRELWHRDLGREYGRFANMWIYGSSPMLFRDRLYIQVLQRNPCPPDYSHAADGSAERQSYLLCVDPATGTNFWRHIRKTDAVSEAQEAYSTPIPHEAGQGLEVLVVGGDYMTAHSPDSGAEIWRSGGLNARHEHYWRIVPSPVVAGATLIACGPKRDPVLGVRAGGKGLITDTHLAWQFKEYPTDCVTPLYYQGKLFVLDGDRQMMTCLDPRTGEKQGQTPLGVKEIFRASPTGAAGRLYCVGENGTVVIMSANPSLEVLTTIPMGEGPVRSSVAAANERLFIRTARNLYCVGNTN